MKLKTKPAIKRATAVMCIALLLCMTFATPAMAAGVSDAIESTWKDAAGQIKTIVNNVVFPAVSLILAVLFFVKLAMAYMDYRKHGQFEFMAPALLFVGLVLSLTAPLYLWSILGI